MTQLVKNPPTMQKTWVQSLGWEDPQSREIYDTWDLFLYFNLYFSFQRFIVIFFLFAEFIKVSLFCFFLSWFADHCFLLTTCLVVLFIIKSGLLKSPNIIVELIFLPLILSIFASCISGALLFCITVI